MPPEARISSDSAPERATLLGAPLDGLTLEEAARRCVAWASGGGPSRNVVTLNARAVILMGKDAEFRSAVGGAALSVADGVSISLAARFLGVSLPGRVPGIDLMTRVLALAERDRIPCFFLGARESVIDGLRDALAARYPALPAAGFHHGYFDRSRSGALAEEIRRTGAKILFVALGMPEAEAWCARHGAAAGAAVTMSVGGSFDVLAGALRRSPLWMRKLGLEWLWRFLLEPRKRFRVLVVDHAAFLWIVLRAKLRGRDRSG